MVWPKFLTGVLLILLGLAGSELYAGAHVLPAPWTAYFGSQDNPASWSSTVRGVGRGLTGVAQMASADAGGERAFRELSQAVEEIIRTRDIIIPVGGLGSARQQNRVDAYMAMIQQDRGERWKELVRRQAVALAQLPHGRERIYWQVGNEINSKHFGETLAGLERGDEIDTRRERRRERRAGLDEDQASAGNEDIRLNESEAGAKSARDERRAERGERRAERGEQRAEKSERRAERSERPRESEQRDERRERARNAPEVIGLYAEYYLAPTVEALDAASLEAFGAPGRINIVLGSLANAHSLPAREWLDDLLQYQITGTFAPSLAGKHVYELVDVIAVHYLLSSPTGDWQPILHELRNRWVGQGRIRAVWSTEEVGRRAAKSGRGAAVGLRVAFRLLSSAAFEDLPPTATRANFWGWDRGSAGTTVDDGLRALLDHLGSVPLTQMEHQFQPQIDDLERYALETANRQKGAVALFPKTRSGSGSVADVLIGSDGMAPIIRAEALLFSPEGISRIPLMIKSEQASARLAPSSPIAVGADDTLLILFERKL